MATANNSPSTRVLKLLYDLISPNSTDHDKYEVEIKTKTLLATYVRLLDRVEKEFGSAKLMHTIDIICSDDSGYTFAPIGANAKTKKPVGVQAPKPNNVTTNSDLLFATAVDANVRNVNHIRTLEYDVESDSFAVKSAMYKVRYDTGSIRRDNRAEAFNVSLSKETPTDPSIIVQPGGSKVIARVKRRRSYTISDLWRLDCTETLTINSIVNAGNLKAEAKALFTGDIGSSSAIAYEVELEYIGPKFVIDESASNAKKTVYTSEHALTYEVLEEATAMLSKLLGAHQTNSVWFKWLSRNVIGTYESGHNSRHSTLKEVANKALSITKETYAREVFPDKDVYVTDKADGYRAILVVRSMARTDDNEPTKKIIVTRIMRRENEKKKTDPQDSTIYDFIEFSDAHGVLDILTGEPISRNPSAKIRPRAKNTPNSSTDTDDDRETEEIMSKSEVFPEGGDVNEKINWNVEMACDCEIVESTTGEIMVLIFDVMISAGAKGSNNITGAPFSRRLSHLDDAALYLREVMPNVTRNGKPLVFLPKLYFALSEATYGPMLDIVYNQIERPYTLDGLIMTTKSKSYMHTKNYKWKPVDTIDFYVRKCPAQALGFGGADTRQGMTLYTLFVGIDANVQKALGFADIQGYKELFPGNTPVYSNKSNYKPVQFSSMLDKYAWVFYSEDDSLDGKILEMYMVSASVSGADPEATPAPLSNSSDPNWNWVVVKIRDDRHAAPGYYGNDYKVANIVYSNYIDPFTFDQLICPDTGYFGSTGGVYVPGNLLRRWAVHRMMSAAIDGHSSVVLDEASGRGSDLEFYIDHGVEDLICVERDRAAITSLVRKRMEIASGRKHNAYNARNANGYGGTSKNMWLHGIIGDLSKIESFSHKIEQISPHVNSIICNFALHYMCDNEEVVSNLLQYNYDSLSGGGTFAFSVMDGGAIFDELRDIDSGASCVWYDEDTGAKIYEIRKLYTETKQTNVGQWIDVKLPFQEELVSEPLCNVEYVLKLAKKIGFSVLSDKRGSEYADLYEEAKPVEHRKLSENDMTYNALFRFVILQKPEAKIRGGRSDNTGVSTVMRLVNAKRSVVGKKSKSKSTQK